MLTDHQMNLKVQHFGLYYKRIPLIKKANIVCANALALDWADVLPPEQCSFIMGNPPFVGYSYQTRDQKADLAEVFKGMSGAGVLDYVAAWHITAARYIQANPSIPVAFVSTNSLTQGEQVAILWTELLKYAVKINFAHRTFRWSNEGKGIAAVHCVIMGFHLSPVGANLFAQSSPERANKFAPTVCRLFDYGDDIAGVPIEIQAKQINPYLVDAPTVLIEKRRKPLCVGAPEMNFGSKPTDGGHLLLSQEEADAIRQTDPIAAKYIRPFLGAEEFINNLPRYCLWLKDSTAADRRASPEIQQRMQAVKTMRLASPKLPTQKLGALPYLFGEIRQTDQPYLLIPRVSSEQRNFVPLGYFQPDVICGDANFMLPNANLYHFGMLCSTFHNAWMRTTCGRLKSDYRYSNTIVYNNFPWPQDIKPEQQAKIEAAAQLVLDARTFEENRCAEQGQKCSLAALYASGNMPTGLLKAHNQLDQAVDAAYGYKPALSRAEGGGKDDATRVAFLFERYQALISPSP